jgi:hypothetical protein
MTFASKTVNVTGQKYESLADARLSFSFAVRTGLEPATHGVTGRYSNQLNYRTKLRCKINRIFYSAK